MSDAQREELLPTEYEERTVWEVLMSLMSMPGNWDSYEAWALTPEGVTQIVDAFMHNDPRPDMLSVHERQIPVKSDV